MILTKYVIYRGKKKLVSELSPTCRYKVDVQCPICGEIRNVYYRSIIKAGHHICHKCELKSRAKELNIGARFGRLIIISKGKKVGYSLCKCDCGNIKEVPNYDLTSGETNSCGCLRHYNKIYFEVKTKEQHWNWKGGISGERECEMQTSKYKEWRKEVFKRDNFTCEFCGQKGYKLNAHHIRNWADNKSLRTDVNNGITICKKCHEEFHHKYGRKNTNKEQLKEFQKGKLIDN